MELAVTGQDIRWYADTELDDLLGVENALEIAINAPTSFFVMQTFLGEVSDPFRFEVTVFEQEINDFELLVINACNDNFGVVVLYDFGGTIKEFKVFNR